MASFVDSEVVFKAKAKELGLDDAAIQALEGQSWCTFGSFAFAVSLNPATVSDREFDQKVTQTIAGRPDHPSGAILRRLSFESYTYVAAELKRKVDPSDDAPRKLPVQELEARYNAVKLKVAPFTLDQTAEPSHALINLAAQCVEEGRLRYIDWSRCTSRKAEVESIKEDSTLKMWKTDSTGALKQVDQAAKLKCDVTSELQILNALKRRGVAYEVGKLMSMDKHELLVSHLLAEYQREPPPGFNKVTMGQISAADKEVHVRLAELTRGGLLIGPQGELPLDVHLENVLRSPAIMWLLMPLASTHASKAIAQPAGHPSKEDRGHQPGVKKEKPNPKKRPLQQQTSRNAKRVPMPSGLRGGTPVDDQGRSLCFAYNLGNCTNKPCRKGLHLCCSPGCFKEHAFVHHKE